MDSEMLPASEIELLIHDVRGLQSGSLPERLHVSTHPGGIRRAADPSWRGRSHGGRRKAPYAFTEHGVAMLSGVLRSERAVTANVMVIRAFVRMRTVITAHRELVTRIDELETKYDSQFSIVFDAIRQLMTPPALPRNPIGFVPPEDQSA